MEGYYSIYRGFVADNNDPENLARVKVKVPQIYGEDYIPDYWAWPRGMPAGKNMGLFIMPNKDDCIWVTFENGDTDYPVWEHGWWADGEVPAEAKNNGTNPSNIVLQGVKGHRIEIDNNNNRVKVSTKRGIALVIDEKSGVTIEALNKDVTINSGTSKVVISSGEVSITAGSISVGGSFQVLYNKVPGSPVVANFAQIGVSTKITVGG